MTRFLSMRIFPVKHLSAYRRKTEKFLAQKCIPASVTLKIQPLRLSRNQNGPLSAKNFRFETENRKLNVAK